MRRVTVTALRGGNRREARSVDKGDGTGNPSVRLPGARCGFLTLQPRDLRAQRNRVLRPHAAGWSGPTGTIHEGIPSETVSWTRRDAMRRSLRGSASHPRLAIAEAMDSAGFEPAASRLQSGRSTGLIYEPKRRAQQRGVAHNRSGPQPGGRERRPFRASMSNMPANRLCVALVLGLPIRAGRFRGSERASSRGEAPRLVLRVFGWIS